ncbi:MAG: hypothetical protein CVV44_05310 [Spirochaetae bacterium HGW-Spirochaetae-1]|jgi:hypothetical protein|nr:MAG: hypothetical protein CVV44_05310 [Spirochaetae bacterium HGW-Spirochaetae-1]
MKQSQQSLFGNDTIAGLDALTGCNADSGKVPAGEMGKHDIEVNGRLTEYLEKYIRSYKNINDQIELKGKLIDLIRKL